VTTLTPIDAKTLAARLKAGRATLIDIRESDEYAREHIAGAVSVPLSSLERGRLNVEPQGDVVFHCKSGMRTNANCALLTAHVDGAAFALDGGIEGWKHAGLKVRKDSKMPIEINRQVQMAIGALVLAGVVLTVFVDPLFVILPGVLGAGLLFAGLSGWCGMAKLLAGAPWNARVAS
jgi:rhodanese-related sulfurtransferase